MKLTGKVAIITGSTKGIGIVTARRFFEEGAIVVMNGRNETRLADAAEQVRKLGGRVLALRADVGIDEQVQSMVAKTIDAFGRVDILVNNAADDHPRSPSSSNGGDDLYVPLEMLAPDFWDAVVALNLKSQFLTARAVIPYMKKQQYGKIVNISSRAARIGSGRSTGAYVAAKAGVIGLTKQLCRELAPFNVNCNAVAPGMVLTPSLERTLAVQTEEHRRQAVAGIPMGRIGRPEEIASVVTFLASDDASYINGVTIDVNGGSYVAP